VPAAFGGERLTANSEAQGGPGPQEIFAPEPEPAGASMAATAGKRPEHSHGGPPRDSLREDAFREAVDGSETGDSRRRPERSRK
jgi:hypothetical protein